jgi:hypothetical protein
MSADKARAAHLVVVRQSGGGAFALDRLPVRAGRLRPEVEELVSKVRAYIAYYNRAMAKPCKWTYQGKPLVA